jgi:hypothetical protein
VIDTTLYAKYLTREVTPEDFRVSVQASTLHGHKGDLQVTLQFTKPFKEINFDSLFFQIDSLTRVNLSIEDLTWHPLERKLTITKSIDRLLFAKAEPNGQQSGRPTLPPAGQGSTEKKKALNQLYLGTAAFISIENDSSAKVVQAIKPLYAEELSVINIEVQTDEKDFIVQLIDKSYKVILEVRNQRKVTFADVIPGDYQIRLIIDKNANGRWDPGNYFKNTEPEKVIYYRAPDGTTAIKGVKANWDIGAGEMFITY